MIKGSGLLRRRITPGLLPLSDGILFCPFVSSVLINNFVWDLTSTPFFSSLFCEIIFPELLEEGFVQYSFSQFTEIPLLLFSYSEIYWFWPPLLL